MKNIVEPRMLEIWFGISIEEAKLQLAQYSEPWKYWLYHYCCECPVKSFDAMELPEEFECPECQCQVTENEISWSQFKVLECDRSGLPIPLPGGCNTMSIPFKQMPLSHIQSTQVHPECHWEHTPFFIAVQKWRIGKNCGVITHQGEVLAFIMKDLPAKVPIQRITTDSFTKTKMTLKQFQAWQEFDVVQCTIHGKPAFWLINPVHQGCLPIPSTEEAAS